MKKYHFDFVVDMEDLDTIFSCLHKEKCDLMELKMDEMAEGNRQEYLDWYDNRIKYIKELTEKISFTEIYDENV